MYRLQLLAAFQPKATLAYAGRLFALKAPESMPFGADLTMAETRFFKKMLKINALHAQILIILLGSETCLVPTP